MLRHSAKVSILPALNDIPGGLPFQTCKVFKALWLPIAQPQQGPGLPAHFERQEYPGDAD